MSIVTFEEYTYDLSLEERRIAAIVNVHLIFEHKGKSKAISNNSIRHYLLQRGYKVDNIRLRKMINYIRKNLSPELCANSKGYFMAETEQELATYIDSARQRIREQTAACDIAIKHYEKTYGKPYKDGR